MVARKMTDNDIRETRHRSSNSTSVHSGTSSRSTRSRTAKRKRTQDISTRNVKRKTKRADAVTDTESSEYSNAEKLWSAFKELEVLRYTVPEENLAKYKESVEEELQAAEEMAKGYKEEYEKLKGVMDKKNMTRVLEDARKLKSENEKLRIRLAKAEAAALNGINEAEEPKENEKENVNSASEVRHEKEKKSDNAPEQADRGCNSAKLHLTNFLLTILGAECICISDEFQDGYLCTFRDERRKRELKFNLFIEDDGFDYEPISIDAGDRDIPAYMQQTINFNFTEAPTFLNRIMTVLHT